MYSPFHYAFLFFYTTIFFIFSIFYLMGIPFAFARLGIPPSVGFFLFWFALLGSFVNIPVSQLRNKVPMIRESYVDFWGLRYRVPSVKYTHTVLAVNLGGAVVPVLLSLLIFIAVMIHGEFILLLKSVIGITIVTLLAFLFAKPIKGIGIAMPAFIPPIVAALIAIFIAPEAPAIVAYVSGTLGTLIGADLLHLRDIENLGAPVASIGGAGTFDGIFLSGIIAVLLV